MIIVCEDCSQLFNFGTCNIDMGMDLVRIIQLTSENGLKVKIVLPDCDFESVLMMYTRDTVRINKKK